MEHTNQIAVKILKEEYYDYAVNPECKWHYDSQYKMLVKAIELAEKEQYLKDAKKKICPNCKGAGFISSDWANTRCFRCTGTGEL